MDHFSYLIDREHRFLLIGIIVLVMPVIFTFSGEAFEPRFGIVYRAEEPKRFWWNVVFYILVGLFFVGAHVYQNGH